LLEILNALVGSCKALYRDKALNFVVQVPHGATLLGDREDLFELFGNLIDNASKWADTQVFISLQGTTVEISDDGPGCPPGMLAEITQRGFRADENTPGSGLGLAIAQDIAGTYGAALEFANNSPGLVVRITFKPGTLI
jgi:signal transduction histidine kinase